MLAISLFEKIYLRRKAKNARETDKEVVRVYSVILFSHKNERHWVICRDMDGQSYRVK